MEGRPPRGRVQQGAKAQSFWRMVSEGGPRVGEKAGRAQKGRSPKGCFF